MERDGFTEQPSSEPPDESQERLGVPVDIRLYQAVQERIETLPPIFTQRHEDKYGKQPQSPGIVGFENAPRSVHIQEADEVSVADMLSADEGILAVGLNFYMDGSPYVFESDFSGGSGAFLYELLLLPESRPVIIASHQEEGDLINTPATQRYLIAAREGKVVPPYELTDNECEQLIGVITDPELERYIEG